MGINPTSDHLRGLNNESLVRAFDIIRDAAVQRGILDKLQGKPPPVVGGDGPGVDDIPLLAAPQSTDGTDLLLQALVLRLERGDQQNKTSMEEIQQNGQVQKSKNDEIAAKLQENISKMADSKAMSTAMKVLTWIGVGLAVLIAAITLNPIAIMGAVAAVTMAVMNETGTMEKMTEAIKTELMKTMNEKDAQIWSTVITVAIGISVSLVSAGIGAAVSNAVNIGAKVAEVAMKVADLGFKAGNSVANVAIRAAVSAANVAEKVGSVTARLGDAGLAAAAIGRIANDTVTLAGAGVAVGRAFVDRDVAENNAQQAELKAFLAKIKAAMDDEVDRLQEMIQQEAAVVAKAVRAMGRVSETNATIIRHMG